jgi:hypothetical protein
VELSPLVCASHQRVAGRTNVTINHLQGEPALSASLLRSLSDRVYEKRKNAALDIEAKMRELAEHPRGEAVRSRVANSWAQSAKMLAA